MLAAKNKLFTYAESIVPKPEASPRHIRQAAGEKKTKADCDDMVDLYIALDTGHF